MWFTAGEDFINAFARGNDPTGHSVSERYQISYAAAYRLKKLAKAELTKPEGGLFGIVGSQWIGILKKRERLGENHVSASCAKRSESEAAQG